MGKGVYSGLLQATFITPSLWKLNKSLSFSHPDLDSEDLELLSKKGANVDLSEKTITVPEGFETNLASVPRALWALISPTDLSRAATIHDGIYSVCIESYPSNTDFERKQLRAFADFVFLEAMKSAENPVIPNWKIYSAYYAVRWFGFAAARPKDWKNYEIPNKKPEQPKEEKHEEHSWENEGGA